MAGVEGGRLTVARAGAAARRRLRPWPTGSCGRLRYPGYYERPRGIGTYERPWGAVSSITGPAGTIRVGFTVGWLR